MSTSLQPAQSAPAGGRHGNEVDMLLLYRLGDRRHRLFMPERPFGGQTLPSKTIGDPFEVLHNLSGRLHLNFMDFAFQNHRSGHHRPKKDDLDLLVPGHQLGDWKNGLSKGRTIEGNQDPLHRAPSRHQVGFWLTCAFFRPRRNA